jgi:hypothetical protein
MEVSKTLASQLRDIHDYSRALGAKGSVVDTMGRWPENYGGWHACDLLRKCKEFRVGGTRWKNKWGF